MSNISSLQLWFTYCAVCETDLEICLALHAFISQLSNLQTLLIVGASLHAVHFIHEGIRHDLRILPSLKTVRFRYNFPNIQELDAFLCRRREIGLPIEKLVLPSLCDMNSNQLDYTCLENQPGMKVVWEDLNEPREYICGSGSPDVLHFETKRAAVA
ncbi:hypothetical protein D9613_009702 [Agrocybe pediades]|uniref:Uncharacterized protein n=1 Tax=Agrocybe pediades TaxID=84607 RepID=A0A8H4QVZ3_9AGAR|nr:hypothetical protein D9613_009702 [Agrocybe pediades]